MKDIIENYDALIKLLKTRFDSLDEKIDRLTRTKDCLDGEVLLDNQDLCLLLGVTKKTLQRYRKQGIIKSYSIKNRKMYYKKSEISEYLHHYRNLSTQ